MSLSSCSRIWQCQTNDIPEALKPNGFPSFPANLTLITVTYPVSALTTSLKTLSTAAIGSEVPVV